MRVCVCVCLCVCVKEEAKFCMDDWRESGGGCLVFERWGGGGGGWRAYRPREIGGIHIMQAADHFTHLLPTLQMSLSCCLTCQHTPLPCCQGSP